MQEVGKYLSWLQIIWIIILTIVGGSFGSSGITKFLKEKVMAKVQVFIREKTKKIKTAQRD